MKRRYYQSEAIFWIAIAVLAGISIYAIVFGDTKILKELFVKPIEMGAAILSIAIGAATTRIFTYFSSDNPLAKQQNIRFILLSNMYNHLIKLQKNNCEKEWEETKISCAECINKFYLDADEINVNELNEFISNFYVKFLNNKYKKSISNINGLIDDINTEIEKFKNKDIYINRLLKIKKCNDIINNIRNKSN